MGRDHRIPWVELGLPISERECPNLLSGRHLGRRRSPTEVLDPVVAARRLPFGKSRRQAV